MWSNTHFVMDPELAATATVSPPKRSQDDFHILHKIPAGDTPYVKAKHVQLVEKDPDRAIALFWAAINAGDRVDSALKDMAIVMKQQNRPEEAIEAIRSLRDRCTDHAQEALDNVLLDLYKRCGRLNDQISLLKRKLHLIHQGLAFNGKRTKTARSQGKKFQVSIEQEASRLLGNLGWAYMQQDNFVAAEAVYRKALSIQPDSNKVCNLGICLMKQGKLQEAKATLQSVICSEAIWNASNSHQKSIERAQEMLRELGALESRNNETASWNPLSSPARTALKHHLPGILAATSGFGPLRQHVAEAEEFLEEGAEDYDIDIDRNSRSTRKRSPDAYEEYWCSNYRQQELDQNSVQSSLESRLPLTSDWTNKAYVRSPDVLRWGKSRKNDEKDTAVWKDQLDENIPSAARRCLLPTFNSNHHLERLINSSEALIDFCEESVADEEVQDNSDVEDEKQEELRFQRRLKVFEEITLPSF